MRKMLINATQPEETRIAITEDGKLFDIDIEHVDHEQKKSNIYKAKISRIEPSLNAVFVNYGEEKNGFLPAKEIAPEYFTKKVNPDEPLPPLNEILNEKQELIVQINKEERGTKGAALTTFLTLAGCYVVLMPNNPSAGGISRRIEGKDRQTLKSLIDSMNLPDDMGIIVRTAGADRTPEEIEWDLNILVNLWETIQKVYKSAPAPFLIHRESDITMRAIRDYLRDDIDEIIVDTDDAYQDLSRQISMLRPDFLDRLRQSESNLPLFSEYHIESQIENAYQREVRLPSGGSIVIDNTEALTSVDVNSAKSTKKGNIEDTALHTNLEAAEEIARQIRLRDIGGLIIIDFIDMEQTKNQKEIENYLAEVLQKDRAKIQLTRISRFGLVEISRQRLSPSLDETSTMNCPRCEGQGIIRSVQSLGLSLLRLIEEESLKEQTNEVRVQLPVSVSTFLLNEKRSSINDLEQKLKIKIVLIPNSNLDTPHYKIQRIWGEVYTANKSSHDLIEPNNKDAESYDPSQSTHTRQQPAIRSVKMNAAPQNQGDGFFSKLVKSIFGNSSENKKTSSKGHEASPDKSQNHKKPQKPAENKDQQKYNNKASNNNQKRKPDNKNKKPKYQNSNRTNIYKSEELIDISAKKQTNNQKPAANKPPQTENNNSKKPEQKPSGLKATPLVYSPKSTKKPDSESYITEMVKSVLENSATLAVDQAHQVETQTEATSSNKYLTFKMVNIDQLKQDSQDTTSQTDSQAVESTNKPTPQKTNKPKNSTEKAQNNEAQQPNYNPAIDPASQAMVASAEDIDAASQASSNEDKVINNQAKNDSNKSDDNPGNEPGITDKNEVSPANDDQDELKSNKNDEAKTVETQQTTSQEDSAVSDNSDPAKPSEASSTTSSKDQSRDKKQPAFFDEQSD